MPAYHYRGAGILPVHLPVPMNRLEACSTKALLAF
jgi:hypothetical protein